LYDYKHPSNDSDPKTMAMAECKPLAWTETNKGCNPRRISLALPNEFPIHGIQYVFFRK
jgi:hypothetical protein